MTVCEPGRGTSADTESAGAMNSGFPLYQILSALIISIIEVSLLSTSEDKELSNTTSQNALNFGR